MDKDLYGGEMSENKTKMTGASVKAYLDKVESEKQKKDAFEILAMMKRITKKEPKMWGPALIGFDSYHYKYESGREGDWFITGFSPRKNNLSVYLMPNLLATSPLMEKLGKHKTGKGCLYFKSLDDIDRKVLEKLIKESYGEMKKRYK